MTDVTLKNVDASLETRPTLSRERELHVAIVYQAIQDACEFTTRFNCDKDRIDARNWLLIPNSDFNTVCDLAGLDPDSTRAHAGKIIADADSIMKDRPARKATSTQRFYEHGGKRLNISGWSRKLGVCNGSISRRLSKGMPFEDIVKLIKQEKIKKRPRNKQERTQHSL